ncbi:head GIN domain-containing protein [Mangrovimonas aestuarii]|uniref:head GIN domain-containing protein n=1 Tax=Mangrovimonas aestuarii TaxID=3018443 RepID=UPI00237917AD|nr:head GIN domain-containing protein [Mangrovimonas aestuarii]
MRNYINFLALVLFLMFSCSTENAYDCFQASGKTIQKKFEVAPFNKILVNRNVALILKQGDEFLVTAEAGEYLMSDIEAAVVDGELRLTDKNSCNFVRDYEATKVYVTAPNITAIRSSTQFDIVSIGVLQYDDLILFSEDYGMPGSFTIADFRLQVISSSLKITANNLSSFYISGEVDNLTVGFYSGAGRFEGGNLIAQNVSVYHRGSNDMIVNPQQSLNGQLLGTGDLISVNTPTSVSVEQGYTGELIMD